MRFTLLASGSRPWGCTVLDTVEAQSVDGRPDLARAVERDHLTAALTMTFAAYGLGDPGKAPAVIDSRDSSGHLAASRAVARGRTAVVRMLARKLGVDREWLAAKIAKPQEAATAASAAAEPKAAVESVSGGAKVIHVDDSAVDPDDGSCSDASDSSDDGALGLFMSVKEDMPQKLSFSGARKAKMSKAKMLSTAVSSTGGKSKARRTLPQKLSRQMPQLEPVFMKTKEVRKTKKSMMVMKKATRLPIDIDSDSDSSSASY